MKDTSILTFELKINELMLSIAICNIFHKLSFLEFIGNLIDII